MAATKTVIIAGDLGKIAMFVVLIEPIVVFIAAPLIQGEYDVADASECIGQRIRKVIRIEDSKSEVVIHRIDQAATLQVRQACLEFGVGDLASVVGIFSFTNCQDSVQAIRRCDHFRPLCERRSGIDLLLLWVEVAVTASQLLLFLCDRNSCPVGKRYRF